MYENRSWMYLKILPDGTLNPSWCSGVIDFVGQAFSNKATVSIREGKECIPCPCKSCQNLYFRDRPTVTKHLLSTEFCSNYMQWSEHGEGDSDVPTSGSTLNENQQSMQEMLTDVAGPEFNWDDHEAQQPNSKAAKFFAMLAANEEPLWEMDTKEKDTVKCHADSVLSAVMKCLSLKAEHNMSQRCFDDMIDVIKSFIPKPEKLPDNFYKAKKLVKGLDMNYEKIDVCINFCMLYYKDRLHKQKCDECGEDRYEPPSQNSKKQVPRKVLRYLPITPRLQKLFMTRKMAKLMRYHKHGVRENPAMMVHPADGEDWKQFDQKYPEFASEARNVRLGLSTDGFMPFNASAAPYSCWPVFVFPYNLPPDLLMKKETMFLALIIPSPKHPGRDINICLEPLIDELNNLWLSGEVTYDVSRKENFTMRAVLLWTVSDR